MGRFLLPRWFQGRISGLHPWLYHLAVAIRRAERWVVWGLGDARWATRRSDARLPCRIKVHRSRLIKHRDQVDLWLQENKVHNLHVTIPRLDGILIQPGETFSFCRRVGLPTRRKGYRLGLELAHGRPRPGIGGGICQIANMLHWLALHTPLTVVERSEHSVDPFPDQNRSIPFGTGAAIFYNHVDLQFRNDTPMVFQFRLWIEKGDLCGECLASEVIPEAYHVFEKHASFEVEADGTHRRNEIWRKVRDRRTGRHLRDEFIKANDARVLYDLPKAANTSAITEIRRG